MATIPDELKYTSEHEWVLVSDASRTVRVGITDFAQEALGDVVYVQLPEVGAVVTAGAVLGEVESTKSVSDLYSPVAGTISARNDTLTDSSELVNSDPYGAGWMVEIELADGADLADLLDATGYAAIAS
ncbi:MAG TPA: glycine cleavage system protein GcvH [Jatrophihabitans sp.]|jgi:glycine cleavage system H protein